MAPSATLTVLPSTERVNILITNSEKLLWLSNQKYNLSFKIRNVGGEHGFLIFKIVEN